MGFAKAGNQDLKPPGLKQPKNLMSNDQYAGSGCFAIKTGKNKDLSE